jgi:hypothetical protein
MVQRAEAGQAIGLAIIRRLAAALDVEPAELMRQPPDQPA